MIQVAIPSLFRSIPSVSGRRESGRRESGVAIPSLFRSIPSFRLDEESLLSVRVSQSLLYSGQFPHRGDENMVELTVTSQSLLYSGQFPRDMFHYRIKSTKLSCRNPFSIQVNSLRGLLLRREIVILQQLLCEPAGKVRSNINFTSFPTISL